VRIKKYITIFPFLLIFTQINLGQKYISNAPYFTLFAGDLSILSEEIIEYYDSKNDLVFGVGFGVPVSNPISIDFSMSYFQKNSNYPSATDFDSFNSAVLKQIFANVGFAANLMPKRIIGLSLQTGLNYAYIDEEKTDPSGNYIEEEEGYGNLGVYVGADFELSLGKGPIAIFGDAKYTYSWKPLLRYGNTYRDLRYTAGLKIYLKRRWR